MTEFERDSMRARRLIWPRNDGTAHVFTLPCAGSDGMKLKKFLKEWIATSSSGEFYLGHNVLCFYTEKDAMMFKLADYVGKASVFYELQKANA